MLARLWRWLTCRRFEYQTMAGAERRCVGTLDGDRVYREVLVPRVLWTRRPAWHWILTKLGRA